MQKRGRVKNGRRGERCESVGHTGNTVGDIL